MPAVAKKRIDPTRRMTATRRLNYQKLLVAVYFTSDEDVQGGGLMNTASNDYIAGHAGLKASTLTSYLREFEADGHVEVYRPGVNGVSLRVIVITDHPKAKGLLRLMRANYGRPPRPRRSELPTRRRA